MTVSQRTEEERRERRGLILSIWGAMGMAALGVGFAMVTHSQAVLLDGLFSLIGAAVAVVTLRVATLIRKPEDECFHFGYAAYEPMLTLSKGLLIATVSLFALVASVDVLLQGGRPVRGGLAVVDAVIAATGCLVIALIQRRLARRAGRSSRRRDHVWTKLCAGPPMSHPTCACSRPDGPTICRSISASVLSPAWIAWRIWTVSGSASAGSC